MKHTITRPVATVLFLLVALFASACGGGGSGSPVANPPPPTAYEYQLPINRADTWTIGSAADQGVGVAALEQVINDIRDGQFGYIDSIAIARNGVLVFDETIRTSTDSEDTLVSNTDVTIHRQFSASKSITSLVVGIAIDEGYIANADVPFLSLFPYTSYLNWDTRKDGMTLGHVLAMRAGLEWNEWDPPYTAPGNQLIDFMNTHVDYSKGLLDLPLAADPGSVFAYNTVATIALGQAVENVAPLAVADFALNELMLPMGITDLEVLTTPTGLPNGGSGFYVRTRDMAKFGQLIITGGTWNGERVLSEAWIADSTTPRTSMSWSDPSAWDWELDGYAYQWWTGQYEVDGTRYSSIVAWGFGGQWVIAVPELALVVAINSHGYDGNDVAVNQAHTIVRNYILPAVAP